MPKVVALIHKERGVFGISFPDFPGCISTGNSFNDVVTRGRAALALHMEGMAEDGTPMPQLRGQGQIREEEDLANAIIVGITLPGVDG